MVSNSKHVILYALEFEHLQTNQKVSCTTLPTMQEYRQPDLNLQGLSQPL